MLLVFCDTTFRNTCRLSVVVILLLILTGSEAVSQEKKRIDIIHANSLEAASNIANNAQRLIGDVQIQHKTMFIWCDSAYTYTGTNKVDAFGNVHINQGDTLHLYANKIFYNGDINFARAWENVKLVNKTTTLYSDTIDYDLAANIGYYDDNGKIVDSTNTLTSVIGKYFIDTDIIHFYRNVEAVGEKYTLTGDTMYYNTETGRISIVGPTTIRDSSNSLYAEDGWYDSKSGEAELLKNPRVYNETQFLKANYIKYNEENGNGKAVGSVQIHDMENKIMVEGLNAFYNKLSEVTTVTDSAVLIMYSEKDTLYMHADTLRSIPDTLVEGENVITAYYDVRFYRSDIQGMCDSLVYFSKDSVVQLHNNPVIWSDIHQLSADFIEMKQYTDAPDEMHLINNSFIISKQDTARFDQVKGKNMVGYVVNNELDRIDVDGNGQTLYYAREKENDVIGLNRAESSKISIQFREGKVFKISFLKAPEGKLKPLQELTEEDKRLAGFDWKINLRPLTRTDIFRRGPVEPQPDEQVPDTGKTEEEQTVEPVLQKKN